MTRDEALAELRKLAADDDTEMAHIRADQILVELFDDAEIIEAYNAIEKWYA
jgi:hypothetical protein